MTDDPPPPPRGWLSRTLEDARRHGTRGLLVLSALALEIGTVPNFL